MSAYCMSFTSDECLLYDIHIWWVPTACQELCLTLDIKQENEITQNKKAVFFPHEA